MTAGYSGTPLLKKLGIKETTKLLLVNAPSEYFEWVESDLSSQIAIKKQTPDLIHLFAKNEKEFIGQMEKFRKYLIANPNLTIWVSWYKKASGIPTDMNEHVVRKYALSHDLVDVKVCAVTEQWTGFKLVVPVTKRKKLSK